MTNRNHHTPSIPALDRPPVKKICGPDLQRAGMKIYGSRYRTTELIDPPDELDLGPPDA